MSYHRRYVRKKNRRRERIKVLIIASVCVFAILLIIAAGFIIISSNNKENTATQDNAVPSVTKKIAITEKPTKSKQETSSQEETSFVSIEDNVNATDTEDEESEQTSTNVLSDIGIETEDFDFEQLIVVQSNGTSAHILFFEQRKGIWKYSNEIKPVEGFVGAQGVSAQASEYAQFTPAGLYSLGTAFGICDNPGTEMEYFRVTENSYWVDDPNSSYYNQHVEGNENADWQSAEHLIEYNPAYKYAVFIEYNTNPAVSGKGSAFFIHVGCFPTAGCIAISEDNMIETLRWLDSSKRPHILII